MQTYKKLFSILSSNERLRMMLLLVLILIMAIIDMLGIASIMPFMAVLANPEIVETNSILNNAYKMGSNFGIITKNDFLIAMGVVVFLLLIASISFKASYTLFSSTLYKDL